MLLSSVVLMMVFVFNVIGFGHSKDMSELPPTLPFINKYKDVFVAGQSGRPTLGTMSSTCWARGGVCLHIRECPDLKFDSTVAGCSGRHRVCCKMFKFGSPTVGLNRKDGKLLNLNENRRQFWDIAIRNSKKIL